MKLKRSLYNILQYMSTIDDIFTYNANNVLVANDKVGSGFTEVSITNFFEETVVIKSLSKFLKLFSFGKAEKGSSTEPESLQDWTLDKVVDPTTGNLIPEMYLKMPSRTVKIRQGSPVFLQKRENNLRARFDKIALQDAIKLQIDSTMYKQIISDCSLLDLDTINIVSENSDKIKIYLTKKDKGLSDDYSSYTVECLHTHIPTKISISINSFSLIDASDHQLEYGKFVASNGMEAYILKIKSFYTPELTVKKVIIGSKGE